MRKTRVMIVEDTAATRELLRYVIDGDANLEIAACVGSAEEALAQLADIRPDIISMDIHLPGMGGLDAIRGPGCHIRK